MATKAEVEASMARIKALQAMLAGGGAAAVEEEEDDYDPNDPNQQPQEETEADIKWREEQELAWEKQQAEEREAAAKAKEQESASAAGAAGPAPTAATPAASGSSSSAASSLPVPPPAGPHQWSTAQLSTWLGEVKADVRRRGDIFAQKGWTKEELSQWYTSLDAAFAAAQAKVSSSQLTGAQAAAFDINTNAPWASALGMSDEFLSCAVWASWKQALRKWQQEQKK